MHDYISLFEFVRLSQGKTRSLFVCYHESKIYPISNDILPLLELFKTKKVQTVLEENKSYEKQITAFIDFLIGHGLAFYSADPTNFMEISEAYESYSKIENAILKVELDNNTLENYPSIIDQLNQLGTEFIEIRLVGDYHYEQVDQFVELFATSNIMGMDIFLEYNNKITEKHLNKIAINHQRISNIYVYNAPELKLVTKDHKLYNGMGNIFHLPDNIDDRACGKISLKSMQLGQLNTHFLNKKYNSCLYGKISINEHGDIKNCPSMNTSFGNINEITLEEAMNHPEFKKMWDISKDKIHVCKDCEFRYVCTDCRAYIEDPKDILSKPLKCGYNPYTGEWNEWSLNPLKQKAIEFYEMGELVGNIQFHNTEVHSN